MSLAAVIALLQAALALLTLVSAHPELGQAARDNAMQVASQAITAATQTLANPQSSTSNTPPSNTTPASSLITTQTCPHVDPPTCSTYGIATFDTNGCVTKYTCAPVPTPPPPPSSTNTQTAAASCAVGSVTYASGQSVPIGTWCQQKGGCPAGLIFPSAELCSNGQWIAQ